MTVKFAGKVPQLPDMPRDFLYWLELVRQGRLRDLRINRLREYALSSDPDDPPAGSAVIWLSDGTGSGSEGDWMIKRTDSGGTTSIDTVNLFGVGGSAIVLDLGNNGSSESTDLSEIATTNDTNNIFTEPSGDKLLIDVSKNWPDADNADKLDGVQLADITWSDVDMAKTDVGAADVGLGNVPNEDATDPQNWDPAKTNGNFLVGDGTTFVTESGATARTSLGLFYAQARISSAIPAAGVNSWFSFSSFVVVNPNEFNTYFTLNADTETFTVDKTGFYKLGGGVPVKNTSASEITASVLTRIYTGSNKYEFSQNSRIFTISGGSNTFLTYNNSVYLESGDTFKLQYFTDDSNIEFDSSLYTDTPLTFWAGHITESWI